MNGFFTTIILCTILLSLFLIFLFYRKINKSVALKKRELAEIISEADEMLQELNRFSDYIVGQMETKSQELNKNLKQAEEKISAMSDRLKQLDNIASEISNRTLVSGCGNLLGVNSENLPMKQANEAKIAENVAVNGYKYGFAAAAANYAKVSSISTGGAGKNDRKVSVAASFSAENSPSVSNKRMEVSGSGIAVRDNNKVIPINKKYNEVIKLSNEGMNSLDIAKSLNMGLGEVELVLELRG